jgi:TAP-like protein
VPLTKARAGLLQQALACATHAKSPRQLALLAAQVGPRRILVVHGTSDATVPPALGADLLHGLGGAEAGVHVRWVAGQGHVIPVEMRGEFGRWVRAWVERWEGAGVAEGWEGSEGDEVETAFEGNGHVGMNGSAELNGKGI